MRPQEIEQRLVGIQLQEESDLDKLIKYDYRNTYACNESGDVVGLNLCGNELTDEKIAFLWGLRELKALNLSENKLSNIAIPTEMPALSYLNISENELLNIFSFLGEAPSLKTLNLSECAITQLTLPKELITLEKLFLQKNKLAQISFKEACRNLLFLDLSENQLETLSLPAGFKKLKKLYLNDNQISGLKIQGDLPMLDTLHLRNNQLTSLSVDFLTPMPHLESLYLYDNSLPDVIKGFVENNEYQSCLAFIQSYFRELGKGKEKDNECKILLIGNGNVGKSCLVKRLVHDQFEREWHSTHGIILERYKHHGYVFNIWDFGGQDIYHATHRLFMQSNAVYLLLWDWDTHQLPFTPVKEHGKDREYENFSLEYWLDYAIHLGKDSPVVIIQTKTGRDGIKDLPLIREAYQDRLSFLEFKQIESEEDDWDENGYHDLLSAIRRAAKRTKTTSDIPENWAKVRRALRDRQEEGEKKLALSDYLTLAKDLENPISVLENWLVKTGVVFYQKGLFHDEIILDQQWAIDAIYTIFDRNKFYYRALQNNQGEFSGKELEVIWEQKTEKEAERELFISFMLSCEMCFETTKREEKWHHVPFAERTFVAPQLRSKFKPNSVSDTWIDRPALHLRYRHQFLHYGVIQSFIVRTQTLAEMRDIWRYGIQIKEGDQLALVEVAEKEVQVQVTANGKPLLNKIRNLLDELQDQKGVEYVSADGENYVLFEELKGLPQKNRMIKILDKEEYIDVKELSVFLERNENLQFGADEHGRNKLYPGSEKMNFDRSIRNRSGIPPVSPVDVPSFPHRDGTSSKDMPASILFVAANPSTESRIQTDLEYRGLQAELERGSARDLYTFLNPKLAVTISELMRARNQEPFLFHFSGHGEEEGIVITNEANQSQLMPTTALQRLFGPLRGITQIVILNACYSAEQAKVISEYGMYVVGNNLPIKDPAAISFSKGFYNGLGEGKNFEMAFNDAMTVVITENPRAANIIEVWKDGNKLNL